MLETVNVDMIFDDIRKVFVIVAETTADCVPCNVVAEVQGSEVVPVLFPKAPVCEKTTAL